MRRLVVIEEVDSTNTWLAAHADYHRAYTGIRALRQTAGRGRLERKWHSTAEADDLTCSFVLPIPASHRPTMPLIAARVLHSVLSRLTDVKIKWPNDILSDGKKLAGILCESLSGEDSLVIVGIGLNVNSTVFPPEIHQKTTSLAVATGQKHSAQKLWLEIYRELVRSLRRQVYPLTSDFIRAYNRVAYRYLRRPEISDAPLEFLTLLTDGRAKFAAADGKEVILDMAE